MKEITDDLVEKLDYMLNYARATAGDDSRIKEVIQECYKGIKAKLLQPRPPTITREEIEIAVYESLPKEPLKTVLAVEAIVKLLKSKGIPMKSKD